MAIIPHSMSNKFFHTSKFFHHSILVHSCLKEALIQLNLFKTSAETAVRVDYQLNLQAANPMDMSSNPFTVLYVALSCD